MQVRATPALNDRQCYTVKQCGDWLVEIVPMIFNYRIVLTPAADPDSYAYGWCYFGGSEASMARAVMAAVAFDPRVDLEPHGYDKAVLPRKHLD